jgi:hypothetical protein
MAVTAPKRPTADDFRRLMPRQFTKTTKLCAKCCARVKWDDDKRRIICPRCQAEY